MEQHTRLPPKRITSSMCPKRISFPEMDSDEDRDYDNDNSFFSKWLLTYLRNRYEQNLQTE